MSGKDSSSGGLWDSRGVQGEPKHVSVKKVEGRSREFNEDLRGLF